MVTHQEATRAVTPHAAKVVAREWAGRKYAVELIGTFFLVFTIATSVLSASALTPLAIGAALMVMGLAIGFTILTGAIAVGTISGGAFNPAVTIGGAAIGLFAWPTLWAYLVAQVVAGTAAGLTFLTLNPNDK